MYYVLASQGLAEEDGSDIWPPHPQHHNRQNHSFLNLYFIN